MRQAEYLIVLVAFVMVLAFGRWGRLDGQGSGHPKAQLIVPGNLKVLNGGSVILVEEGSKIIFPDATELASAAVVTPWGTSGTDIYNINSGNVGIGTEAPSNKLQVIDSIHGEQGDPGNAIPQVAVALPSGVNGPGQYAGIVLTQAPNQGGGLYLTMGSSEADDIYYYHQNAGTLAATGNMKLMLRAGAADSGGITIDTGGSVGVGTSQPTESLEVMGNIRASGSVFTGSSRKLKESIADLTAKMAMEAVAKLKPVTFIYKADNAKSTHAGFIAEEAPDLVTPPSKDAVSPMDVVALLTKVVQEQQKTIAAMQDRINTLESKLK